MVIGICGGSGSGKTTLLNKISSEFEDLNPTIFSMDNYYRLLEEQQKDENGEVNFDLPTALNKEKLTSDLQRLIHGEKIEVKEYFFNAPPDKNQFVTLQPSSLIIVEGIFLFYFEEVRKLLDFTIFIDVDLEVQLHRRINRDQETRGYSEKAILYQWEHHVLPCYNRCVLPYRNQADFRFRNDEHANADFDALIIELNRKLTAQKTV